MGAPEHYSEAEQQLISWAQWTIATAIEIRSEQLNSPWDDARFQSNAGAEVEITTDELRSAALEECGDYSTREEFDKYELALVEKVITWCYKHMNP